jgi:hypothetical protein
MTDKLFSAEASGKRLAATTISGGGSVSLDTVGTSIRVVNHGPDDAYFSVGDGVQTATVPVSGTVAVATCTAVLAHSDITLGLKAGNAPKQIAARTESGTATLDVYIANGA